MINEFNTHGRIWLRNALSNDDLSQLERATTMDEKAGQRVEMSETLARCTSLARAIAKLDPAAKPVRVVAFNKSQDTNWGVPWHQDRVISVAQKHEVDGFKNWTLKSGGWHCEPPQH